MSIPIERITAISEALASQDNCCTEQPMFLVRQKKRQGAAANCDPDGAEWRTEDGELVETDEAARLEAAYEACEETPGRIRWPYVEHVEFVTACFTRKGAESFIALEGHNLSSPHIYVAGSYRNNEWRAVRQMLLDLPGLITRMTGPEMRERIRATLSAMCGGLPVNDFTDAVMALLTAEVTSPPRAEAPIHDVELAVEHCEVAEDAASLKLHACGKIHPVGQCRSPAPGMAQRSEYSEPTAPMLSRYALQKRMAEAIFATWATSSNATGWLLAGAVLPILDAEADRRVKALAATMEALAATYDEAGHVAVAQAIRVRVAQAIGRFNAPEQTNA